MTDATRWSRLEEVFHSVADLPADPARDAIVRDLCAHDPALVGEVAALLAEDAHLRDAEAPADPHLGLRLGHYQIDALIGRGGMAAVYAAHRADDQFHQRVAIKIMDLRLSDPVLVARFRAERQILAVLEHPALTRLLDGGMTALGEPYLVMEYVDGQPIDRYCDAHQLDVADRLRLCTEVCAGVAFAHRNLVLHRDLKPSNILVTSDGHAKVVDFGTATLLEPDRLSTVSHAPLTPAYASPEQLTGQAVGTASDQYSLGLVFYQLLTGTPPFAGRTSLMAAMERAVSGTATTAPHTVVTESAAVARRTTLARLRRVLTGDLGTILTKTLAHDPAARYASVQHVADDLALWAGGQPIRGRAPSLAYHASRFVRRHWVATSLAATLAVALIGATVVSFQQAAVARRQTAIARAEATNARQFGQFLAQTFSMANPTLAGRGAATASSLTVRQMLDGAGVLIAEQVGASPEVEAQVRRTLGETYLGLGAYDDAMPHLERALALERGAGQAAGVAATQALLGLGFVQKGDMAAAEDHLRHALEFVRGAGADVDPILHFSVTNDLGGAIAHDSPGNAEALALLREAIDVATRHAINPGSVSVARLHLGIELMQTGRIDEAAAEFDRALQQMDALPVVLPERSSVLRAMSQLEVQRGDFVAAEHLAALSVAHAAKTRPADHPLQLSYHTAWGQALVALGEWDRGQRELLRAYDGYTAIRPPGHLDFVGPLVGLGTAYRLQGDASKSLRVLREAEAIARAHPDNRQHVAEVAGELGLTLRAMSAPAAATLLKESYDTYVAIFGNAHPTTARALARLNPERY